MMDYTFWHKQSKEAPLFPDLLWDRPVNRKQAGKLLIIGGNLHGFAAPAEAYQSALKAGIGEVRVLLPNAIKKIIGGFIENAVFAPSTPSGSFSRQALDELLEQAAWSDGVLIAGDLGKNSETAILLESFLEKYDGQVTLCKDAINYVVAAPQSISKREKTMLVMSLAHMQKLAMHLKYPQPITFSMPQQRLAELLHDFEQSFAPYIILKQYESVFVAADGKLSSTNNIKSDELWIVDHASWAAVWWLQNPLKAFESICCGVFSIDSSD